ncbi:MAG: acyclic terpene utilization AtuA family protein [Candidatus Dormibacteria bacterium]
MSSREQQVGVLCASGSLGLTPFHEESFYEGINRRPNVVAADAGSGDIGPSYLGSGHWYNPEAWEEHDLGLMLRGARSCGAKVIVGSAGGAGLDQAVDRYFDIVTKVARHSGIGKLTVARIYSELTLDWLAERLERSGLLGAPWPLTADVLAQTSRAVAMVGVEPYLQALDAGADVIIAGRSCDDALFAAFPIWKGMDWGYSLHMGKCIECGPLVAEPPLQRESVMGTVLEDGFLVEPMHPGMRCTVASVAGHTLYERMDPYRQAGPGGELDLSSVLYIPVNDRVVKVTGSQWLPVREYRVKVEGSGRVGACRLIIFALRDPEAIAHVDDIIADIRSEVRRVVGEGNWQIHFSVFGRDAILGAREPERDAPVHEIAVLAEAVATDGALATQIAKLIKYGSLRAHYGGRFGKGGGAALPHDEVLSPQQDSYRWTIDHLVTLTDPMECCHVEMEVVGG